ncbi:MAG: hypothetical protein ACRD3W_17725 [Terriglobales bacterium]
MADDRREHLQMIQHVIDRMAQCSFQLKGWSVTLAVALEVFLKGEASPTYLFVPALPIVVFWLLDAWYLLQERLFRRLFDDVRVKDGSTDFSMDVEPFRKSVTSVMGVAASPTVLAFYGPVLFVIVVLGFILSQ